MAFVAALLLLLFVSVNYFLHRDLLYPGFVQACVWLLAVSLFGVTSAAFVPVSDRVFILLVAGVAAFSMGAFVASYDHTPQLTRTYVLEESLPGQRATVALAGIVVIGLFLYLGRAQVLASSGPTDNAFLNLRYGVSVNLEETGGFGPTAYFIPLAYLLAAIVLLKRLGLTRPGASRIVVTIVVAMGATFGLLWAARSIVLPLVILVLAIPTTLRVVHPLRTGAVLTLVTLLLFAAVGIPLGKGGSLTSTIGENWATLRESFLTYAVGGIPALNAFMDNRGSDLAFGINTFRSFFALLHGLGFHTSAAPLVQPWVDVPMPTNVYTVYQPYIKDFGPAGAVCVLFVLGFLHGVLYRQATVTKPRAVYVFLFALSFFPLIMQVFQDMYFSLLSFWFQYAAYALLLFVFLEDRRLASANELSTRKSLLANNQS